MKIVGYRTENLLNEHYYYGVRTLRKENDPYLGSGIRLSAAIKKYGKEFFTRVDLVEFKSFEEALEWEKATITQEMIVDPKCYNLKAGGAGGSLPWTDERRKYHIENRSYAKSEETKRKQSNAAKERFVNEPGTFTGRKHTEETKEILSQQRKGKPGKNKGKKLNLSPARLEELRKPKSKEVKDKIRQSLTQLSNEQVRFLKEEFKDEFGARSKLCKEWDINLDQIVRVIGRRYNNKRSCKED